MPGLFSDIADDETASKGGLFDDILDEKPSEKRGLFSDIEEAEKPSEPSGFDHALKLFGPTVKSAMRESAAALPKMAVGATETYGQIKQKEAELLPWGSLYREGVDEQIVQPLREWAEGIANVEPRFGEDFKEPSKLRVATRAITETLIPPVEMIAKMVPLEPTSVAETYVGGKVIGTGARYGLVAAAEVAPRKVLAGLLPAKDIGAATKILNSAAEQFAARMEKEAGFKASAEALEKFKDVFARQAVRKILNVTPAGRQSFLDPEKAPETAPDVRRIGMREKPPAPEVPPEIKSKAAVKAPETAPEAAPVLPAVPETAPPAPVPQTMAQPEPAPFEVPGTEIGSRQSFEAIKAQVEKGEIEIPDSGKVFLAKMEAFWKFHPEAETGIIEADGTISPRAPMAPELKAELDAIPEVPEPGEPESVNLQAGEGNLAALNAEEFSRRFPNAPPEVHQAMVRSALQSGKAVSPEAVKAYDLAGEADQFLQGAEVEQPITTPILDFIRKKGGLDVGKAKESRYMGELENSKNLNILRKKGGLSIPEMAELAYSEGLIPEHSENALFDAMDKEARLKAFGKGVVAETGEEYRPQGTPSPEGGEVSGSGQEGKEARSSSSGFSIDPAIKDVKAQADDWLNREAKARGMVNDDQYKLQFATYIHKKSNDLMRDMLAEFNSVPAEKKQEWLKSDAGKKYTNEGKEFNDKLVSLHKAYPEIMDRVPRGDAKAEARILEGFKDRREIGGTDVVKEAPAFYSKLQKDIESKMPAKATAEQVRALLRDQKQEEVAWSGIEEYLAGKDRISKPELLEFLRANQLEVKEVQKGGLPGQAGEFQLSQEMRRAGFTIEKYGAGRYELWKGNQNISSAEMAGKYADEAQRFFDHLHAGGAAGETKYSDLQLPGGENYRELLLTLPEKQTPPKKVDASGFTIKTNRINEGTGQREVDVYGPDGEWVGSRSGTRATDAEIIQDFAQEQAGETKREITKRENFRSSHWDEPNILAHVRFNDRVDADGKKVLFIEELQSDWHQKGRREGYKLSGDANVSDEYQPLIKQVRALGITKDASDISGRTILDAGGDDALANKWMEAIKNTDLLKSKYGSVPDAPLKKTWHEFALKRMIRYAAENGYDKIAWTTGEQQAERYDLSKQVDAIHYKKTADGEFKVWASRVEPGNRGPRHIEIGEHPAARLPDVVGKEIADKIIAGEGSTKGTASDLKVEVGEHEYKVTNPSGDSLMVGKGTVGSPDAARKYAWDMWFGGEPAGTYTLSGLDLKVGGEGMKGFYDKIVPSFLSKFGKKFGAEVGETVFATEYEPQPMADPRPGGFEEVHSLTITPELRRTAIEEGFSVFEKKAAYRRAEESSIAFGSQDAKSVTDAAAQDIMQLQFNFDASKMPSSGIADRIQKDGRVNYRGLRVENARQAAELFGSLPILKKTKTEYFQVMFSVGGEIVDHWVISSGLPDGVLLAKEFRQQIFEAAARLKAEVIISHNHPSGQVHPSGHDHETSAAFKREMGPLYKGHVVTNGEEYTVIDVDGEAQTFKFETPKERPAKPLGPSLNSPHAAAVAGKSFTKGKNIAVIYTDTMLRVIAIESMPPDANVQKLMKDHARIHGASSMMLVHGPKWSPVDPAPFPARLLDIIGIRKDGAFTSVATEKPDLLASMREPDDFTQLLSEVPGYYRVQEAGPEYGPDEFQTIVSMSGIKPGTELTLKKPIVDPSIKGGRLTTGTRVKVVDIDKDGGLVLIQAPDALGLTGEKGVYATAKLQDFLEPAKIAPVKQIPPSQVKPQILESTGVRPTEQDAMLTEMQALKIRLQAMEKGAKFGAREGARKARAQFLKELKAEMTETARAKDFVVQYIKDNLEIGERGRFLTMVAKARTFRDVVKAFVRVDHLAAEVYKKSMISDIRNLSEKALDSAGIAVEYKAKIKDLLSDINLKSWSPKTINKLHKIRDYINLQRTAGKPVTVPHRLLDRLSILARRPVKNIPELELERILDDLKEIIAAGAKYQQVRSSLYQLRKENITTALLKGTKPLERNEILYAKPGQSLDITQRLGNLMARVSSWLQDMDMAVLPNDVMFDMQDGGAGYNGPNFIHIKKRLDGSYGRFLDRMDEALDPVKALISKYNFSNSNFERIGIHADRLQPGGRERLKSSHGLTDADIDAIVLTPQEIEVYQAMRRTFDSMLPDIKEKMAELYNLPMGDIPNYFPYIPDFDAHQAKFVEKKIVDVVTGKESRTKKTEKGFTKERLKGAKAPMKVNAWERFKTHVQDSAYFIEMQGDVKMLFEIVNTPAYFQVAGQAGQKNVLDFLDVMARAGGVDGASRIGPLDMLRQNLGAAQLGLRLSSILVQPTSMLDGAARIGGTYVLRGLVSTTTDPAFKNFLYKNLPELRARVGDDPAFAEESPLEWLKKLQKAGYAGLRAADSVSATAVAAGAYLRGIEQLGLTLDISAPVPEALDFANLMLRRTQASPAFKDLGLALSRTIPGVNNRSISKAIFQFQTFALNRWSVIRYDIPQMWQHGNKADAAWAAGYLGMAVMAETGIRRGTSGVLAAILAGLGLTIYAKEDDDPYLKDMLYNMLDTVPFVGALVRMGMYEGAVVPVLNPITDLIHAPSKIAAARNEMESVRATTRAIESLAGVTGIPGVSQVAQLVRLSIQGRTLPFPFARELQGLRAKKKSGLTKKEAERMRDLQRAEAQMNGHRARFKAAVSSGNIERAKREAEAGLEQMRKYK